MMAYNENLLDEEAILLEENDILQEAMILSASNIDTQASAKEIAHVKTVIEKAIASGKYRRYQSSDATLVKNTVKSKGMLKTVGMSIAGSIIGAGIGYGASKGSRGQVAENVRRKLKNIRNKANSSSKSSSSNNSLTGSSQLSLPMSEDILVEAIEFYLDETFETVLNEIEKFEYEKFEPDSVIDTDGSEIKMRSKKSLNVQDGASAGAGALAGGATGAALARRIVNSMRYKLFLLGNLTILSFYSTDKEGNAKGHSVCYAIAVHVNGNHLLMKKINLKAKK